MCVFFTFHTAKTRHSCLFDEAIPLTHKDRISFRRVGVAVCMGGSEGLLRSLIIVGQADVEHGSKDHVLKPNRETLDG